MKDTPNIILPIQGLLWVLLGLGICFTSTAQSGSQGSTFIGPGLEMAVYQDHSFRVGSGSLPGGLIGTERNFPYGIFSFVNGSQWNGASDQSHVDGYVRKYGTGSFTFPIGDNGRFRPLRISGTFGSDSSITAAYFGVSPGVAVTTSLAGGNHGPLPFGNTYSPSIKPADVGNVSNKEYWHLMGEGQTVVSLSYDPNSQVNALTQNDLSRLRIVGWHKVNQRWEIIGSLPDNSSFLGYSSTLDSGSVSSLAAVRLQDYTIFTFGGTAIPIDPDTDGDGVPDKDDECPLLPGVAPSGCPVGVQLAAKVWLQGALYGVSSSLMRDDLRVKNLIPIQNPYPSLGYILTHTSGPLNSSVFLNIGDNAIVDWIVVELRSKMDSSQIVAAKAGLLQRDGDIVDIDGSSVLTFSGVVQADYYVAIRHRNHLGVMTANAFNFRGVVQSMDFRQANFPLLRLNTQSLSQPTVLTAQGPALWAGNVNYSVNVQNRVIFQGTENDVNPIYQLIFSSAGNIFQSPSFKLRTYNLGDVDLNGETVFQGSGNDIEFIYSNIIQNHSGNIFRANNFFIREQLPY